MSLMRREQEAKLALIESIAHSQQALARILDSVASVSAHSEVSARSLAENIRLLSRYQEEMSRMVTGIRLARNPAWGAWLALAQRPRVCNSYRSGHTGGMLTC